MKKLLKKIIFTSSILTLASTSVFAQTQSSTKFVKVTHSEPIYSYVTKNIKECYQVPVQKRVHRDDGYRSSSSSNSIGVDTLVGATLGVVIGNQIGRGNGKDAARIVGGLLGAAVANNTREDRNYYQPRHEPKYETVYETRCETRKHHKQQKAVTGYKNYFNFRGVQYSKISERPLRKVRIEHSISF